MAVTFADKGMQLVRQQVDWARRVGLERKLTIALLVAAFLSGIATYAALTGSFGAPSQDRATLVLLLIDLIVLLLLGTALARRLVALWMEPARGITYSPWLYWLLTVYLVHAVVVMLLVRFRHRSTRSFRLVVHGADILWPVLISIFTAAGHAQRAVDFLVKEQEHIVGERYAKEAQEVLKPAGVDQAAKRQEALQQRQAERSQERQQEHGKSR